MTQKNKTSLLVSSQLPEFIRDNENYSKFVSFVEAYYEWMEQNGNVLDTSRNLKTYMDVDETTGQFIDYFINDFLQSWPEGSLLDKNKAVKYAKQFYQKKGTPSAYQFLFRVLYDSDFDVLYTKDSVLRASAGQWYISKSLKLSSLDENFLKINNLRLFGEKTKSIATIENAVKSSGKIEVFISNIERLFESGEFVRVVDANNQDYMGFGYVLRAKILGQLSQIKIDPLNRGLLYQVGDPVIVYDGLNSANGVGAKAQVSEITAGAIQRVNLINGGFGYRLGPNTKIDVTNLNAGAAIPIIEVGSINPASDTKETVSFIPKDTITLKRFTQIGNSNYFFSNASVSNVNTTLAQAFTFDSFDTFPLSSVLVLNAGGGISQIPQIYADSIYNTDLNDTSGHLKTLGILAPLQILDGGVGYQTNDVISFIGGSGYGANAIVASVNSSGSITKVDYVVGFDKYSKGGRGYTPTGLPSVSIVSANTEAYGASFYLPGILGDGATFSTVVDRVGSISTIKLTNPGEDYVSTPNVSLKVQDILVSNVNPELTYIFDNKDIIYQGVAGPNTAVYYAYYDSLTPLVTNENPEKSIWNLRVFNYNSSPDPNLPLKVGDLDDFIKETVDEGDVESSVYLIMANTAYDSTYNKNGIKTYGDGSAKASASFLNGLVISQGQYLNNQGQPSSFDVLQSTDYNNFTYIITVEKEIAKYKDVLLNLLHPTGMKVKGKYAIKANGAYTTSYKDNSFNGHTLQYYTESILSTVSLQADFLNRSNNIVNFYELNGKTLSNFISVDDKIIINSPMGPNVESEIVGVDDANSTITLSSNVWLTYGNVATATITSSNTETGSAIINIVLPTGYYDIMNNGQYSNTRYPMMDIVSAGDFILTSNVITGNSQVFLVDSVNYTGGDYSNGAIQVTSLLPSPENDNNVVIAINRTIITGDVQLYKNNGSQYT